MPRRAASPAESEVEFDITKSLFENDSDSDGGAKPPLKKKPQKPDTNQDLDFLNEDDGDAAFILSLIHI